MNIIADERWIGDHGIGRFAREILSRIDHQALDCSGHPAQALDPARLTLALAWSNPSALFFSPGYNAPLRCRQAFVFSIHDLNHIDRNDNSSRLKRIYYDKIMRPACHRAAIVFTVSEFSKQRIVDWASIDPERVVTVGNGVDASFAPTGAAHTAGSPYFICVSNRRPHKNEMRLVSAFARAAIDPCHVLLMTGEPTADLAAHVDGCGLGSRVRFCGRVSDDLLAQLYRGAIATLFPSLYEGFGLPVVESMACGTPVLTSNTTALVEIASDAALLADPESIADIASGIERLCADSVLRSTLSARGSARAREFTWQSVAERARAAFEKIASSQPT